MVVEGKEARSAPTCKNVESNVFNSYSSIVDYKINDALYKLTPNESFASLARELVGHTNPSKARQ